MSLAFLIVALLGGHTMASMAMTLVPSMAPAIARDYEVDPSLIGYQIACVSLGQLSSLMFLGNLSRKLGAARAYQMGLAGIASGMLLMVLPSTALLIAGSVVLGIGHGLLSPSSTSLLMRFTPQQSRNFLFSFQQTSVPFGGMLAALFGPTIAVAVGWQWALAVTALLLASAIAFMQRGQRHWDTDRDPATPAVSSDPFEGVVRIWRHPQLRLMALAGGAFCWAQFIAISYTVVAAVAELGMSLIVAGTLLTVVHLGSAGGRIVAGWLADRAGGTRVLGWMAWLLLANAAAALWMAPSWPAILLYALFAVLGVTTGGWAGVVLAETARRVPHGQVGAAMSGAMVYVNGGKLIGPVFFANVYALTHSYDIAFATLALPAIVAIYCLAGLTRREQATGEKATP